MPVGQQYCKLDEVQLLCHELDLDILSITETWIDNKITDDTVSIEGYKVFRRNRDRHGGGVATYVRDSISASIRTDLQINDQEMLALELLVNKMKVIVLTWYRPPGQLKNKRENFLNSFEKVVSSIICENPSLLVCLGDFNDRCTTWDENHNRSELGNNFRNLVTQLCLHQIVSEPTRITANQASLLDLVITDSPGYVNRCEIFDLIADLDHCIIYTKFKIPHKYTCPADREVWHYRNGDFAGLNEALNAAPWQVRP